MKKQFQTLFYFGVSRPIWTLVLFAIALVAVTFEIRNLNIDLDFYGKEQKQFLTTRQFQEHIHRFNDVNGSLLIFSPANHAFSEKEACEIDKWIRKQSIHNFSLKSISWPFDLRVARVEGEKVWYRPFIDLNCESPSSRAIELTALKNSPWYLMMTSPKNDIAIELVFKEVETTSKFGKFDPTSVSRIEKDASEFALEKLPGSRVYIIGSAAFHAHIKDAMVSDLSVQSLILIFLFLCFRYLFGRWRTGFVFVFSLSLSLAFTYGLMAFFGDSLDLLTNNLLLMTALASLEDFFFVGFYMKRNRCSFIEAARDLTVPCFFTTLTTAVGFWSLNFSGIEVIQRFGIWEGVASFFEWFIIFMIFPAIAKLWPSFGNWISLSKAASGHWLKKSLKFTPSRFMLSVSVILFALGILGFHYLNINEHPAENFPIGHLNRDSYEYVKSTRGWENAVPIVFQKTDIRDHRKDIEAVISKLKSHPQIVDVISPFALQDFVGQFLPKDKAGMTRLDLLNSPADIRIFSGRDQARAIALLKSTELKRLKEVQDYIKNVCSDGFCFPVGQSVIYLEYAEKIVPALLSSFLGSTILISIILLLVAFYCRVKSPWKIVYSAIWGPITMAAIIALFQIPVSLITSVFASTIMGLTGDNAIQYMFAARNGNLKSALHSFGEVSIVLSVVSSICSLFFLLETIMPMRILGILFFIGFIVNLIGDLWILKGLLPEELTNKQKN